MIQGLRTFAVPKFENRNLTGIGGESRGGSANWRYFHAAVYCGGETTTCAGKSAGWLESLRSKRVHYLCWFWWWWWDTFSLVVCLGRAVSVSWHLMAWRGVALRCAVLCDVV